MTADPRRQIREAERESLELALADQLDRAQIPYERQYLYAKGLGRKVRADFAITEARLLVEADGGIYRGDVGHASPKGIARDMERTNLATLCGWYTMRFHAKEIRDGTAISMILQFLDERKTA